MQIDSLYALADQFFSEGNYSNVLRENLKALSLAEKTGICSVEVHARFRTASAYYHLKQREQSRLQLNRGLEKATACGNTYLQARALRLIGSMKCDDRDTDSALFFLKQAEHLLSGSEKWAELSLLNAVLGETYFDSKDAKHHAVKHLLRAEEYATRTNDINTRAFALIKLGKYSVYEKRYKEAEQYFAKALDLYRSIQSMEGEMYALRELAFSKSMELNSHEVYELMEMVAERKDSVFNKETADKLADYHTTYETEKKELELKAKSAELAKEQQQALYTTIIAVSLIILILLSVSFLYYRYAAKQKLLFLTGKEEERQRIARDLHDHLGSNISYIISKTGQMLGQNGSLPKNNDIAQVKEAAEQIMAILRETIWILNKPEMLNTELADKIKQYVHQTLLPEYDISEKITQEQIIPVDVAMAIYRCIQEIISNINKHSKATHVSLSIASDTRTIVVRIRDNGIGFENAEKEDHYGIRNIKQRMKEIGAEISITSVRETGTEITIVL